MVDDKRVAKLCPAGLLFLEETCGWLFCNSLKSNSLQGAELQALTDKRHIIIEAGSKESASVKRDVGRKTVLGGLLQRDGLETGEVIVETGADLDRRTCSREIGQFTSGDADFQIVIGGTGTDIRSVIVIPGKENGGIWSTVNFSLRVKALHADRLRS